MIQEGGAIEGYNEADWILGSVVDRGQIADPQHRHSGIVYNQDEYKSNTCTVYACMGAYSDLKGIEIPLEQRKEIVDLAIEQGLDVNVGRYLHKAVKLVADYFGDVSYVRFPLVSIDARVARNTGFTLMAGYRGNATYNADRNDDKIVQTNDWGEATYGHAPRYWGVQNITDNYPQRASNIYELPEIEEKAKSGNLFTRAFIYFDKIEMPDIQLPKHITKDDVDTPLQRDTIIAWENEMKVHIQNGGELLYTVYYSDDPRDYPQILARMLNDLQEFRK